MRAGVIWGELRGGVANQRIWEVPSRSRCDSESLPSPESGSSVRTLSGLLLRGGTPWSRSESWSSEAAVGEGIGFFFLRERYAHF